MPNTKEVSKVWESICKKWIATATNQRIYLYTAHYTVTFGKKSLQPLVAITKEVSKEVQRDGNLNEKCTEESDRK